MARTVKAKVRTTEKDGELYVFMTLDINLNININPTESQPTKSEPKSDNPPENNAESDYDIPNFFNTSQIRMHNHEL